MAGVKDRKQILKAIKEAGFVDVGAGGSGGHRRYAHPDGRSFVIPDLSRTHALSMGGGSDAYFSLRSLLRKNGVSL